MRARRALSVALLTAVALTALEAHPAQASRPFAPQSSISSSNNARRRLSTAADANEQQQQQQQQDADPAAGIPHTHPVYVEYKVAHSAGYMAVDSRSDKLLRLVREAGRVSPGLRVSAAAVDGGPPVPGAGGASTSAGPPSLTYGAVVFNEEDGAAEREVAALAAEGALERLAAAARSFGVVVSALEARLGSRRLR